MAVCLKIVWLRSPGSVSMKRAAEWNEPSSASTSPVPSGVICHRSAVDPQAAVAHGDAVARQADDALHPNLRPVARPAKHDDVAALGQRGEDALRVGQS